MRKMTLWTATSVLALACGPCCYKASSENGDSPDCPGKIVCPISGEELCKDPCPLIDPNRPDCPGKIECPLTGERVCSDRCPFGADPAETGAAPTCCARWR